MVGLSETVVTVTLWVVVVYTLVVRYTVVKIPARGKPKVEELDVEDWEFAIGELRLEDVAPGAGWPASGGGT